MVILTILIIASVVSLLRGYNKERFIYCVMVMFMYIPLMLTFVMVYASILHDTIGLGVSIIIFCLMMVVYKGYRLKESKGLGTGEEYPEGYMFLDKEEGVGKVWHDMKPVLLTHMMFCVVGALGNVVEVVSGLVLIHSCVIIMGFFDSLVLLANNKKRASLGHVIKSRGKGLYRKLGGNLYVYIRLILGVLGLIFFYFSVDNRIKDMLGGGDFYYLYKIIMILGGVFFWGGRVIYAMDQDEGTISGKGEVNERNVGKALEKAVSPGNSISEGQRRGLRTGLEGWGGERIRYMGICGYIGLMLILWTGYVLIRLGIEGMGNLGILGLEGVLYTLLIGNWRTKGGERLWVYIGRGLYESELGEVVRKPEGDLLPERYWYLRLNTLRGLGGVLVFVLGFRYGVKVLRITGGWELGLMKVILLVGNMVTVGLVLIMVVKTGIMGGELIRKLRRGEYRTKGWGGGGGGQRRRWMWTKIAKDGARLGMQGLRTLGGLGAGGATLGMSLDWYGEAKGKGKTGTNALRAGGRALGFDFPKPEYPDKGGIVGEGSGRGNETREGGKGS